MSLSEEDIKKVQTACNNCYKQMGLITNGKNKEFIGKTITLLNDARDFRDDKGNTILHLLLRNGYFDVDVLQGLLANGHNINATNNDGYTAMGYVDCGTFDFIEKYHWLVKNGANAMYYKKDSNGNEVNDIDESTMVFLESIVPNLMYLHYDEKTEINEYIDYNPNHKLVADQIKANFDKLCGLVKLMINKKIIAGDLSINPQFIYYNPILTLIDVEYIKKIESVLKLNWNVDKITPTGLKTMSDLRTKKHLIHNHLLRGKMFNPQLYLNENKMLQLLEHTLTRVPRPKNLCNAISLVLKTSLTSLERENKSALEAFQKYNSDEDYDEFWRQLSHATMTKTQKLININKKIQEFCQDY